MKVSEHFANAFFRAEDFDKTGRNLTVTTVEIEPVGKEEKMVIHFDGEDKCLPVNKTNALQLAELIGDDTDDWTGQEIRIYRDTTMFAGKRVSCMRIGSPRDNASGSGSGSGGSKRGKE